MEAAIRSAIVQVSNELDISPRLIAAFVMIESSGLPLAYRFEDHYRWFHDISGHAHRLNIPIHFEERLQKYSYGLMQVMGAVAREYGHEGSLLELFDPLVNLRIGVKYFKRLSQRHTKLEDAVASYNAGSPRFVDGSEGVYVNQGYVDKFHKAYREAGRYYEET